MQLDNLLNKLTTPYVGSSSESLYEVLPIPGNSRYLIGKDKDSSACLLISTDGDTLIERTPIRLENLDVLFDLPCNMNLPSQTREGKFTILKCRSNEPEIVNSFLSVCQGILKVLGKEPSQDDIAKGIDRFVRIFSKLLLPPSRTVNGLIGELFVISICSDPVSALLAWRRENSARFDFSLEGTYLEVKTTTSRKRSHKFTYDQCNPPEGSLAIVASMFVEQSTGGTTLRKIFDNILESVSSNSDLILKLHEVVNDTLGKTLKDGMDTCFDIALMKSSLKFYDLRQIPAIRESLSSELSDVSFRSNLSAINDISIAELSDISPRISLLLPEA